MVINEVKINNIPKNPGVYHFLDKNGKFLYIGKAKNLRTRVKQYFGKTDERPQIPFLMNEAVQIDYTITNTELESLYLERTLIQKYKPKYNIDLRDDKNYAFLKIDFSTKIPQLIITRKITDKQSLYFGPFTSAKKIRDLIFLSKKIFGLCMSKNPPTGEGKPCFNFHLHRCPGVCVGKISLAEYKTHLLKIAKFLKNDFTSTIKQIRSEMHKHAKSKRFEKAAVLRDQIKALETLVEKQNVILPKKVYWDIISIKSDNTFTCLNLFQIREGKMLGKEDFIYEHPEKAFETAENYDTQITQKFLEDYYSQTNNIPKEIILPFKTQDTTLIESLVNERFKKTVKIIISQKGRAKQLVDLGKVNAEEYLKNWLNDKAGNLDKTNTALIQLQKVLNLKQPPQRIECFDISNIQGTNAVGSMVVFENGLPKKSEYRKFRIKSKNKPDDFAMMKEILNRRFSHSVIASEAKQSQYNNKIAAPRQVRARKNKNTWLLPDLIVIDGGKGQLSAALSALQATSYKLLPIIGLAKRIEEIFIPEKKDPVILSHDQPALQLLQRLRDEAHRFGITFHRALRSKQAVKSALDEIPRLGPKTKKLLKIKFGTISIIKQTSFNDLAKVVGKKLAGVIKQNL